LQPQKSGRVIGGAIKAKLVRELRGKQKKRLKKLDKSFGRKEKAITFAAAKKERVHRQ
jgi:hypothetical protein